VTPGANRVLIERDGFSLTPHFQWGGSTRRRNLNRFNGLLACPKRLKQFTDNPLPLSHLGPRPYQPSRAQQTNFYALTRPTPRVGQFPCLRGSPKDGYTGTTSANPVEGL
jgi:hypothetical protein